ncbi:MAG: RNA 2',3'-cyclic phosphodiesterase [Pseudomonadota bacterium]
MGLDIPAPMKMRIEHWREQALPSFKKPVSPANYHITLAFLGNIGESELEHIDTQFEGIRHDTCSIALNSLGFWPKPKILFLGTTEAHDALACLAKKVSSLCHQINIAVEQRSYVPHVTLVRGIKNNPPCALFEPDFKIEFDQIHLFESVSTQKGVKYPIRRTWAL